MTVSKGGGSANATVSTLGAGATQTSTPVMPTKTITITVGPDRLPGAPARKQIRHGQHHRRPRSAPWTALPSWGGTFTTTSGGLTGAITVPQGTNVYTVKVSLNPCGSTNTYKTGTTTGVSVAAGNATPTVTFGTKTTTCVATP